MEDIDRRSALAPGLATAATLPALFTPTPAFPSATTPTRGGKSPPG
jgi:hypothetical protein